MLGSPSKDRGVGIPVQLGESLRQTAELQRGLRICGTTPLGRGWAGRAPKLRKGDTVSLATDDDDATGYSSHEEEDATAYRGDVDDEEAQARAA